ncbi:mitogen-activated protein kinase kinase kinase NPK1-like [Impatiens glandulifera]|uniref:mitogen-activated protein kinase kinase kinase NPK1-like n=1 Tax=Impatiens glandulifera TaxID=253017 RepID=UPI001FB18CBA|nr:mitogen-activated protein kinase kinase kinase NPK1-like [Impatiens glandulifera]
MQEMFGSVRRSLVFRDGGSGENNASPGTLVDKINSCIRKSRVFSKLSPPAPPPKEEEQPSTIRWRKGELIGCGAFGQVYMGMNLDSGELLAVKQVLIAANTASKEKAQTHVKELEEEVKLLKRLSHPNIVRYLGTVREEDTLNILLEFVPGGSISSLLSKFGSFPEAVIRMYTKQLLLGLDYLHKNGIMHRDIKGANILVDNKGRIKLADFGASKQVVELATISGAKSMKGTPYWMAPEVIRQTGHSFSADIWSVGCTVIEMATGKPPWSEQYQEVAALFYIGTTKSHPPIPEHLSEEAKDFLLKCLQKEPDLRPSPGELLQHPFVTEKPLEASPYCGSMDILTTASPSSCRMNQEIKSDSMDLCNLGTISCSISKFDDLSTHIWKANNSEDDMCQIDDNMSEANLSSFAIPDNFKSFNPMCEPSDDWKSKTDMSPGMDEPVHCGLSLSEDDDEVTESKIRAFIDEKALELKKLQSPLYEEFYNSFNPSSSSSTFHDIGLGEGSSPSYLKLPPKSKSPNRAPNGSPSGAVDCTNSASPGSCDRRLSNASSTCNQPFAETPSPKKSDVEQEPNSSSFSERRKKWKEELDQELERKREMMRQAAGMGGVKTQSPKDRVQNRAREKSRFASPTK